jgi:hypothetical protein
MILILAVESGEYQVLLVTFEYGLDFCDLCGKTLLRVPFKTLPFFRYRIERQSTNADDSADNDYGNTRVFEYPL